MSARAVALRALSLLCSGKDERIRNTLEKARLSARDRAFAWDLAHGVVRNERLLDFVLSQVAHRGLPKDPTLLSALRLGAYQLLLVDGMPPRAAVFETVALVRRNQAFINAGLRRVQEMIHSRVADPMQPMTEIVLSPTRCLVLPDPGLAAASEPLAVLHSLPDFLVARWRDEFGEVACSAAVMAASEIPPLHLNCLATSPEQLAEQLAAEGCECEALNFSQQGEPELRLLRFLRGTSPWQTRTFAEGGFVIQDPTAARAAAAVRSAPGETVVDLCAAPGTKTMCLAQAVHAEGVVYAFDVDPTRRVRIAENARRVQLEPWVRIVEDSERLPRDVDAVLVDAPCSNSGVLARRVEVRRRLRRETFGAMAQTQRELVRQALQLVRPGGRVVYSTCSIDREENQGVVADVLSAGAARLELECLTLPEAGRCDGGYYAVLRV
jgi:16S rRNA (cytosine967-C5)-methyltransferase